MSASVESSNSNLALLASGTPGGSMLDDALDDTGLMWTLQAEMASGQLSSGDLSEFSNPNVDELYGDSSSANMQNGAAPSDSNTGMFGGGSTPYESMMRDHLLSQLPPDKPDDSLVCTADSNPGSETAINRLAIGGTALEGSGLAAHYTSEWFETPEWIQYLGKAAPWMERFGHTAGWTSVGIEAIDGFANHDLSEVGHGAVDGGVLLGASLIGGPPGFIAGAAWTVLDQGMQHYTFQGQHGWTAFTESHAWSEVQDGETRATDIQGFNAGASAMREAGLIPR